MDSRPKFRQRAHRKSRLGCKICKERKIKCDEMRPSCGNCVRRFTGVPNECEFDDHDPPPRKQRCISSSNPSLTGSPSPSLSSIPRLHKTSTISPISRSLELRLFHHYSTVTCHTLPLYDEAVGHQLWAVAIPNLAFECQYVYSSLLSFAALHLLALNPHDVNMEAAAYHYIDNTVSSLKEDMKCISKENSVNIFTTAALITIQTKIRSHQLERSNAPYELPINYFHLQAGARKLFNKTKPYIEGSDIKAFIEWRPDHRTPYSPASAPSPFEWPEDSFLQMWETLPDNVLTPSRKSICDGALTYLSLLKKCISDNEPRHWVQRRLSISPSEIPEEFLGLLEERDPLALVILARVFALLRFVDGSWWLSGTAEYDVKGLKDMIDDEWLWAMEWPLLIINSVGKMHQLR